jgi:hypothetical protein
MVAASAGFSKACALLLENGANLYSVDQNGKKNTLKNHYCLMILFRHNYFTSCDR